MKIEEVRKIVAEFVRGTLQKEGRIVKTSQTREGWEAQVEVIEPSEYTKALGIPTVVMERNLYAVELDQNLEVVSYERIGPQVAARKPA